MSPRLSSVGRSFAPSGLVIAVIGFLLTRGSVALAADSGPVEFLAVGVVPLVLGLGLSAFGVVLTVGSFPRPFVRRTVLWCVAGTVTLGALIGLTVLGQATQMGELPGVVESLRANGYLSNVLLGGSVGGTLTGLYAARSDTRRSQLRIQTRRMRVINRLLRDRVLNAVTVIRGRAKYLQTQSDGGPDLETRERSAQAVTDRSQTIENAIDDITYLAGQDEDDAGAIRARRLAPPLSAGVERARKRYPDATIDSEGGGEHQVWADVELEQALYLALTVAIDAAGPAASVSVRPASAGDGESVRLLVEAEPADGTLMVDPSKAPVTTTKLAIVELLVDHYGGSVRTETTTVDGREEASVVVSLPRASVATTASALGETSGRYGISIPQLGAVTVASLAAGLTMGLLMSAVSGVVPVIGALYGLQNPLVGWITHTFHSVVFGVIYAGLLALAPISYTRRFAGCLAMALAWGVVLWAGAAGIVMPFWLQLVGLPATIPQWQVGSLVGHLVWGLTLAAVYYPLGRSVAVRYGATTASKSLSDPDERPA